MPGEINTIYSTETSPTLTGGIRVLNTGPKIRKYVRGDINVRKGTTGRLVHIFISR